MSWKVWMAGGVSLLVLVSVTCFAKSQAVAFTGVDEVKAQLIEAGYYCTSDRGGDTVGGGILVSVEPSSPVEASSLCKAGPMGPKWRGKVWITVSRPDWTIETVPDDAGVRAWGTIIAFGDPELLRDLDNVLAPTSRRFF